MLSFPKNKEIDNLGEKIVFEFLNKKFNDEYILYHNYEILGKEFDFLFINKIEGIFLIEVKEWNGIEIIEVKDNYNIIYRKQNGEKDIYIGNPLKQVREYKFNLINKFKNLFNSNIRVNHLVVYPNMTEELFYKKNMGIYTERERVILADDMVDKERFIERLTICKSLSKENLNMKEREFLNLRSMFESEKSMVNKEKLEEIEVVKLKLDKDDIVEMKNIERKYSQLIYLKENDFTEIALKKIIQQWKLGCKIHLITDWEPGLNLFCEKINESLGYLRQYSQFDIVDAEKRCFKKNIFNINLYYYKFNDIQEKFVIEDGAIEGYEEKLTLLDIRTGFNINQFKLEHHKINENIIVEAGAGTGKTYSMISRITYLIYKHNYPVKDVIKKIVMITFTNEAANNMKKRLKEYYKNYYLLTQDIEIFELVAYLEEMHISTIHSLAKKIIDKFSHFIGLGENSTIYNGKYELSQIINENLNEYINKNLKENTVIEDIKYRLFRFEQILMEILEKLEQKNVRISNGYTMGEGEDEKCKIINDLIPKIQEEIIEESKENNKVRLSNIMLLILEILNLDGNLIKKELDFDYLFVDEFQDTDDVQIDIMKKFKEIVGFKILVVGDIKQCIYRFRGADDTAFEKLRKNEKDRFEKFELLKNYRTDKTLLGNLNEIFFKWNKEYIDYESGLVGIKIIKREKYIENIKCQQSNIKDNFIKKLKCEIEEMKESEKKGTIAILVRTNKEIEEIRELGKKEGINIKADIGNNLFETEAIKDLYKLVCALNYNLDPKYLYNLFNTNYMLTYFDRNRTFNLRGDKKRLLEYFKEINTLKKWDTYVDLLKKEPIMKVIREIIEDTEPWNVFKEENIEKKEKQQNAIKYKRDLEQIIEWVISSSNNDYLTINNLVKRLEVAVFTKANLESRSSELDEINNEIKVICATVHKTKGLEYEIVMIPFCDRNKNNKNEVGSVDIIVDEKNNIVGYSIKCDEKVIDEKDDRVRENTRFSNKTHKKFKKTEQVSKLKEEVRILYVALTRAIEKVVYFSVDKGKKKEEIRWQDLMENSQKDVKRYENNWV